MNAKLMKTHPFLPRLFILVFAGTALLGRAEIRINDQPPKNETRPNIAVPKPTTGVEDIQPTTTIAAPDAPTDVIFFDNSDTMHGRLLAISPQMGVRWKHPDSKQAIDFSANNITRIKLDRRKATPPPSAANCVIRLTNGDELMGDLISVDAEKMELDTWYAGRMSIQRKMVKTITPAQSSGVSVYDGPTSLEGWAQPPVQPPMQKSWTYSNGAFISTSRPGSIGRDVKLPAVSSIDFDLSWRPQLTMIVCFYADTVEGYTGSMNAYTLNISQIYMNLQRMRRDGGSAQLGQAQVQHLQRKDKARFSIRSNKDQGTIWLLVDDIMVQQWKDPTGFAGVGTGLMFYAQGNSTIKLSNLRIREWDGKFEEQVVSSSTKTKEDSVRLVNNDKVSGKIQTIRDGKLTFVTSYATLDIAMQRVTQIEMADERSEQAKRNAGDVRLSFAERGQITLQVDQWDDKQVTGSSQNFGKLKLNPNAFSMVHFNLDAEKPPTDDPVITDFDAEE